MGDAKITPDMVTPTTLKLAEALLRSDCSLLDYSCVHCRCDMAREDHAADCPVTLAQEILMAAVE